MPLIQVASAKIGAYDGVPPDGDPNSRIAFIGEAPAAAEVRPQPNYPKGRPFAGPAGGVLDDCLHNAGLARSEVYVTNLFKRQVVKKTGKYYVDGKLVYTEGKGFSPEGEVWLGLLEKELTSVGANVFVPMGEAAIFALTGMFKPTAVRGSILESILLPGKKCIPTIHPAAALRTYIWKYLIIYDFRRVREQSAFPDIRRPKRNYIIRPDFSTVMLVMNRYIAGHNPVTIDLEIYNNQISCAGFGHKEEVLVIPFTIGTEHYWSTAEEERLIWLKMAELVEHPGVPMIYHNGLFDLGVFARDHILPQGELHDTMVSFKQMYPDFSAKLQMVSSIYTEEPYYKEEFKAWTAQAYKKSSIETLWTYNARDVAVTHESHLKLLEEINQKDMRQTYDDTMGIYYPALYMVTRGIPANLEALRQTRDHIEASEINLQAELNSLVGRPINAKSSPQLKKYFYDEKGITPYKSRTTGKACMDDNALKRLAKGTASRKPLREAAVIRELRGLSKLRTTYLNIGFDEDDRFRYAIHPAGTKNGRWSTSKTLFGTGTNVQNLPMEMKRFLESDPGCVLFEIDKAQGEWVITAFVSGDANMMHVAEAGEDAHTATGHLAFQVPEELIRAENKAMGHETNPITLAKLRRKLVPDILNYNIPSTMTVRQAGKKSNHGLNYNMGYRRFAYENEILEAESKVIVEKYHAAYPGIRANYYENIRKQLQKDRTLTNLFSRKRTFFDRWDDKLLNDAYAFPPQSTLVDLVNRGIRAQWHDQEKWWKRRIDLLAQVHDSVLFQWLLKMFEYRMCAQAVIDFGHKLNPTLSWEGREFTIRNDVKMGLNWGQYHPEHNPVGMKELDWTWNAEEMAFQIGEVHTQLLNDYRNL